MTKPKIVCVMIVKNESECLDKCLESVQGVDNIYIVDTGSEDNTVEIARKYTDNVYEDYKWNDNFAEARNHALSKVQEEDCYVLSIDADEYLHSFEELEKTVDEAAEKGALAVDVKLYAEKDKQMHYFPRLFKKDPAVFWAGAVHNHISVPAERIGNVEITYGYSPAHLKDPNRAFRILQKEVEKHGGPRETFYLGREYWYRGMYQDCITTMQKYVPNSRFLSEKADAFLLMARCYWNIGMGNEARDACLQAIAINAHFREALLFMAIVSGKGTGNIQWEKNAMQWERMAETADNSNVLFVR